MQHLKIYTAQMTEGISMRDEHIYKRMEMDGAWKCIFRVLKILN